MLAAFERLRAVPDLLFVDGQGVAQPRQLNIASHLGLILGLPTIGCAKSLLTGVHDEPGPAADDWAPLADKTSGEVIGAVLQCCRVKGAGLTHGRTPHPSKGL